MRVNRIVDGDTFVMGFHDGSVEKVRLIGIDCPETKRNPKASRDADASQKGVDEIIKAGRAALEYLDSLVKVGDQVTLELDVQERDQYRRVLAYVYLKDGKMLNEILILAGHAELMTIPPNVKYQDRLLKAYRKVHYRG